MLVLGLVSSVHCAGMCGGIVGAFSGQPLVHSRGNLWTRQVFFNSGRLTSYAAAGACAGSAGGLGAYMAEALPVQTVLYAFANVLLIMIGLHLTGITGPLARLESLGAPLWRRLQPLAVRLLPARSLPGAYAAGVIWGWLPCGLVYGALAVAAFAGTPGRGAFAMLAFGLGTLPTLLAAGFAAARLRGWMARRPVRNAAGAAVFALGVYGLAHASGVADGIQRAILCL